MKSLAAGAASLRRWFAGGFAAAALAFPLGSNAQFYPPFELDVTVGIPVSQQLTIPLEFTASQLAAFDPSTVIFTTDDTATKIVLGSLSPSFGDGRITAGELVTKYPNGKITITSFTATLGGDPRFGLDATACAAPIGITCAAHVSYNGAIPAGLAVLTIDGNAVNATLSGTDPTLESYMNAFLPTIIAGIDGLTTLTVNVTVAKGAQAIVFGTAPSGVAVGTTGTVSASGGPSGSPVTFASTTPATCSVAGTTVTGLGAGTCTISANQAGNTNYNAAPQVMQSFSIAKGAQAIIFGTAPANVTVGTTGTVSATGGPSGSPIVFASTTPSTCSVSGATVTGVAAGTCTISANQAGNANYNAAPQVTQSFAIGPDQNPPRLLNISTRMQVLTGNDVMIGGFVIGGSANKTVAIVATGPSLQAFGIQNPLANPTLTLVRSSDQVVIATNDDWQAAGNSAQLVTAGFAPSNTLESAILITLPPGAYTAIVEGVGGGTGVGIVAVYEVDGPTIPLTNISTRGRVQTGNDVMIGGFVITGSGPQTVAIVGTGPSLANFGIANPLANPTLTLVRSSDQTVIATNDDWQGGCPEGSVCASPSQLTAAGFAPSNPLESAMQVTLQPGAYTVILSGAGNGTGVGVIGVYRVQ
jgi:hypothetical protein